MKKRVIIASIILIPILIFAGLYVGVADYFKDKFYFGSVINGVDYTFKTVQEVEDNLAMGVSSYTIKLICRDNKEEWITADDIGYKFVSDGKVQSLKDKQNPYDWIKAYLNKNKVEDNEMVATTTFDENLLNNIIDNLQCMQEKNVVPPQDAYIEFSDDKGYYIVEEQQGNKIKRDILYKLIKEAAENSETEIDLEANNSYEKPKRTKDDKGLNNFIETIERYKNIVIETDYISNVEVINWDNLKNMLNIDIENEIITLNEQAVSDYVVEIARKYDTFGMTRSFPTSYGYTLELKGGDYGWLVNRTEETSELINLINSFTSTKREPIYRYTAVTRDNNGDIGNTYAEIDLSAQRLWFYKDGSLMVDTDVVTGNVSKGWGTPSGFYKITYKQRNATLNGENYSTPVNYWMPFNKNIGMHDADWRYNFGGNIYKTNGSHGCVNIPPEKAAIIYENSFAAMPVIVYESYKEPENTTSVDNGNSSEVNQTIETNQENSQIGTSSEPNTTNTEANQENNQTQTQESSQSTNSQENNSHNLFD